MQKSFFKQSLLASIISSFIAGQAFGSAVRDDVDYQYFRDFAENKGKFSVGALNVPIFNKDNEKIGIMFPDAPIPDFSSADRSGITTVVSPQYMVSVAHNVGYKTAQFGNQGNNPDEHHYTYSIVDRNNYPDKLDKLNWDYHIPRVHKLITEVIPSDVVKDGLDNKIYKDKNRFPYFARVGSGTQIVRNENTKKIQSVKAAYNYLTGGAPFNVTGGRYAWIDAGGRLDENVYGPLTTYGLAGDSGSPIWAFDKNANRWLLYGVLNFAQGNDGRANTWSIIRKEWNEKMQEEDNLRLNNQDSTPLIWKTTGNASSVISNENNANISVDLYDVSLPTPTGNNSHIPSLHHGKTVYLSGRPGTLHLTENINQGAGALFFETDFNVEAEQANTTWLGAGISVDKGKNVNWKVKNPKGDRLSKIGQGTLTINGQGDNLGDISIGDGTVIFDQQGGKAFNEVGLVSGRATLILNSSTQIDPDKLYFGFRGGRLDLNGNDLTFKYIQNVDDGAKIVNHNLTQSANVTITNPRLLTRDELTVNDRVHANQHFYSWDRADHNPKTYDYFLPKKKHPFPYYPINHQSNENWEYIGSDLEKAKDIVLERLNKEKLIFAFNGYFGETDNTKHNGNLNVNFSPEKDEHLFFITGGVNLNGDLNVTKGNLLLSGRPTPHAYDKLKNKDVVIEDDWIDRNFNATNINVTNNASLWIGRNVSQVNANFTASQNAKLNLGFQQGVTPECIRSDYTGAVKCEVKHLSEQAVNSSQISAINGNIQLNGNSQLNLSRAVLTGTIQGSNTSNVTLHSDGKWVLNGNSTVGNLTLNEGSKIKLNHQTTVENDKYHTLTINGNLSGNGYFHFLTNISTQLGDKVVVNGIASGSHKLLVENTGAEPKKDLTLLQINHSQQPPSNLNVSLANPNGFVDLGAFRYRLANNENRYILALNYETRKGTGLTAEALPTINIPDIPGIYKKGSGMTAEETLPSMDINAIPNFVKKGTSITAEALPTINIPDIPGIYKKGNGVTAEETLPSMDINAIPNFVKKGTGITVEALPTINIPDIPGIYKKGNGVTAEETLPSMDINAIPNFVKKGTGITAEALPTINIPDIPGIYKKGSGITQPTLPAIMSKNGNFELPAVHFKNGTQITTPDLPVADLKMATANDSTMPTSKQNRIISRYSNGGLSEISAQVNALLQMNANLHQVMSAKNHHELNVWTKVEQQKTAHSSDNYRAYRQQLNLTQIGLEKGLANQFRLGAVLSNSHTSGDFDDQISQKGRFTQVTVYGKKTWKNGLFASLEASYGKARNSLNHQQKTKFSRHIVTTGFTLGTHWDLFNWEVSPTLAVRYHRLSEVNYNFDGANIKINPLNLFTYQAGLNVGRDFKFGSFQLRPELSSQYIDASHNNTHVEVNGHKLHQQFGRYVRNQFGLTLKKSNWELTLSGGLQQGNEVKKQRIASLKFGYNW